MNIKCLVTLVWLISWPVLTNGQGFEKVVFDENTDDGYLLAMAPQSQQVMGVLVLLPGFGQAVESVFPESKIHNTAYSNGILTVVIAGGRKLYADGEVVDRLDQAFLKVMELYEIDESDFVIGGFSAGGTIALRYAELCRQYPTAHAVRPAGVFSIDAPVDLFAIWEYFQREIKKNYSEAGVGEAEYVTEIMLREIGDPVGNKSNYDRLTPFDLSLDRPGNEIFLSEIPVRVYHDLDVVWQLKNRRRSLMDTNAFPSSEMINRLLLLGNERAEFVPAARPGYRSSGQRHTHSWSIVDEVELIQWVKAILTN